jgi:16S rRNA (adenine1518-N6/adenine1519-N6)-dimethyltransferase
LTSLSALLKKYDLQPRKGLAQNFLADPVHLAKIIATAELTPDDIVLEIGPGPGALTQRLAQAAGWVIAVELDPNMVNLLNHELGHFPNLTLVEADILQTDLKPLITAAQQKLQFLQQAETGDIPTQNLSSDLTAPEKSKIQNLKSKIPYKVIANLPYYITSAILRYLLEATPQPERLVVTVQKEVAQRIVARPGAMSILAVSVQFYGRASLAHYIPAGAFYPPPKVDSAVVRIDTYAQPPIPVSDVAHFFRVVKAGFSQKRKQLKNTLAAGLDRPTAAITAAMRRVNIDPTRRAQMLSLEEWGRLAEALLE